MKEDIEFHKATDVYIAAVKEWDEDFTSQQWNVYLINNRKDTITTVLVMSRGHNEDRKTSTLRHSMGDVSPQSSVKVEFIAEEVLNFTNEYLITFFAENQLLERNFVFKPGDLNEDKVGDLPVLEQEGILAH